MDIKCKKTRKGVNAKLLFDDMSDFESFTGLIENVIKDGDYPGIVKFLEYVRGILNQSDSHEENKPSVTIWQDKIGVLTVAFESLLYAYHEQAIRLMEEQVRLLRQLKGDICDQDAESEGNEV